MSIKVRKKLIEVALPLDAINKASVREKSIRHGHPSTLHLWWARRPLAAARAVIFAQMVDDPSEYVDVLLSDPQKKRAAQRELKKRLAAHAEKQAFVGADELPEPEPTLDGVVAETERERLFGILEELVVWENTNNEAVLQKARDEIWQSWRRACAENAGHPRAGELFDRNALPAFHDPFAGGGALPLEAQRLGLEAHASDLNPVAVLINKAMIEIPPKFAGRPPVNPRIRSDEALFSREWHGAAGLAEDVRYYGEWMRDEAEKRIGHLYPKVRVTAEMVAERPDLKPYAGRDLTVIAWLWARTVKSPNPAFADVDVPLASTFMLSTKAGKEAYVEPVIEGRDYRFSVKIGEPLDAEVAKKGTSAGKRKAFTCLMSNAPISYDHIREEGKAGCMGVRLMAIVAEGSRGRVYLAPTMEHEEIASRAEPTWRPDCLMPKKHRNFQGPIYGMENIGDLFTARQLVALTTFSDLIAEAQSKVVADCLATQTSRTQNETPGTIALPDNDQPLRDGGAGTTAYSEAVGTYLALVASKCSDYWSNICGWNLPRDQIRNTFGRQAIPMVWDYAEGNPFSDSTGNWMAMVEWVGKAVAMAPANASGAALQLDAQRQTKTAKVVSTDPPYYDNIAYADLSDFFYVWLRRSLRQTYPELFATLAVPKAEELVATPYRHGGRREAEDFFLRGMKHAIERLAEQTHPAFPVTVYYAFKQAETKDDSGTASTGWEIFLEALIQSGFAVTGTWPMRTERGGRSNAIDSNALASSIVLVCRKRPADAPVTTRQEFVGALRAELPAALAHLQRGNIAPVDLAQAAIGPGMAVFTRYAKVVDVQGGALTVLDALTLINQTLDEALAEQEGDFDADTRWALAWFQQHGFGEADYGLAEVLSKAMATSVDGLTEAGIVRSGAGKVRLFTPKELPDDWDPATDPRLTAWEAVHHLIRVLGSGGESAAADLVRQLGAKADIARELCYRLYTSCERTKRAAEALDYNALVQSWPEIARLARSQSAPGSAQTSLFTETEE